MSYSEVIEELKRIEILERNDMSEEAQSSLSDLHEKLLYKLCTLSIKNEEFSGAEFYYNVYDALYTDSYDAHVLRYLIDKYKRSDLSVLAEDLLKIKGVKYVPKWGLELARLYDAMERPDACIRECGELASVFGKELLLQGAPDLVKKFFSKERGTGTPETESRNGIPAETPFPPPHPSAPEAGPFSEKLSASREMLPVTAPESGSSEVSKKNPSDPRASSREIEYRPEADYIPEEDGSADADRRSEHVRETESPSAEKLPSITDPRFPSEEEYGSSASEEEYEVSDGTSGKRAKYLDYAISLLREHDYTLTEENIFSLNDLISRRGSKEDVADVVAQIIKRAEIRHMKSLYKVVMSGDYDKGELLKLSGDDFAIK